MPPFRPAPTLARGTHVPLVVGLGAGVAVAVLHGTAALWVRALCIVAGVLAAAVGVRRHRPRPLRPWLLVVAGLAASAVGDVAVLVTTVAGGAPATTFDAAVTALAGLLLLAGMVDATTVARGTDPGGSLDAVVIAVAGGTLLWYVVVVRAAAPGWTGSHTEVAGFVQVLTLVAVLALLQRTRRAIPVDDRAASTLLVIALAAALAAFLVGAGREAAGDASQYLGLRAGAGVAANVLAGLAALHPSMRAITERRPSPPDRLTIPRTLLLGGALGIPPVLHIVEHVVGHDSSPTAIALAWVLLVPAVLARLHVLLRGREHALAEAHDADRRLGSLLAHTGDLLLLVRVQQGGAAAIEYASPSAREVLLREPQDLLGADATSLLVQRDRAAVAAVFADPASWPSSVDVHLAVLGGHPRWFEFHVDHHLETDEHAVVVVRDVTARKAIEVGLTEVAHRDELTGLLNRRALGELTAGLDQVDRPIGVLAVDLDGFKAVNDRYGHGVGDELLRIVGRRLSRSVRDGDHVVRTGGDEFVVLCPGEEPVEALVAVGERILGDVRRPITVAGVSTEVSASIGVAPADPTTPLAALLARADSAMYAAKVEGKGRVVACDVARPTLKEDGRRADEQEGAVPAPS